MFLINQHGCYFCVEVGEDISPIANAQTFESEQAMLTAVCEQNSLSMEEVEGTTIVVRKRDGVYMECDSRGCWTAIDIDADAPGAIEQWLADYEA